MAVPPAIPKILTNADWQQHKSVFAKMKGATGVGKSMDEMAAAYKKVDWETFNPVAQIGPSKVMADLENAWEGAKAYLNGPQVSALRKAIQKVSKAASDAAAEFEKSKIVSKKVTQHAKDVAKAADQFFVAVGKGGLYFDAVIKEFEAKRKNLEQIAALAISEVKNYVGLIESNGKKVLANPTTDTYDDGAKTGFFQNCRGMQAGLAVLMKSYPEAKEYRNDFMKVSQDSFKPKPEADAEEITSKAKEVLKYNAKVKAFASKL